MRPAQFAKVLQAAIDHIEETAAQFGERYRLERIKPFCDRHGLHFISGMGTTVFYLNGEPVYSWDSPARLRPALERFERELAQDLVGRHGLGEYVADYKPDTLP